MRQFEDKEFCRIVWSVVDKLDLEQKQMVIDHYINDLDFVEIAEKYGKTKSGVTQLFDTIYHHLRILFVEDSEFQKTDYAIHQKKEYLEELKQGFEEFNLLDLLQNGGGMIGNIIAVAKRIKQEFKVSESLKITH